MKPTMKRLLSITLCLMMLLSLLPAGTLAAPIGDIDVGTVTLYCEAPSDWAECYVYWWHDGYAELSWPGVPMRPDPNGRWYYEIPADAAGLLFHNNAGTQSSDQQVPNNDGAVYFFEEDYWIDGDNDPTVYYVAGSEGLCGIGWCADAPQNMMTQSADGTWSITYTGVAVGLYGVKVTNGTWDQSWGELVNGEMQNHTVIVNENNSTVVITFDPVTKQIYSEVTAMPVPVSNTYYLVGYINGADYGFGGDEANMGQYRFVNGQLTVRFECDSYVFIKTEGNQDWYMTETYVEGNVGHFRNVTTGNQEKMRIPGNVTLTLSLRENPDGSLTLSYYYSAMDERPDSLALVGEGLPGIATWDPADPAGDMTEVEPGIYEKVLSVSAGTDMQFRIVGNDMWNEQWNFGCETPDLVPGQAVSLQTMTDISPCDMQLTVEEDCTLRFIVDLNGLYNGGKATLVVVKELTPVPTRRLTVITQIPWNNVYIYTWEPKTFGLWPGMEMQEYERDVFETEIPGSMTNLVLSTIMPDGSDPHTDDIFLELNNRDVTIVIRNDLSVEVTYDTEPVPPVRYRTLTVVPPASWLTVNAYTWDPEALGPFPGTALEKTADGYELEIPVTMTNLVLSGLTEDGTLQQPMDIHLENNGLDVLVMITEDLMFFVSYVNGNRDVYRVVGNAPWMGMWDAASDAGRMDEVAPGVYEKCFEKVQPGYYEFKITQNGTWDVCWGAGGDNFGFYVDKTCNVTVTFFYEGGEGYIQVSFTNILMGDVTDDGKLNMGDVAKLYAYIRGTAVLPDEALLCADMTGDGKVNMGDVARLYSRVRGTDMAGIVDDAYDLAPGEQLPNEVTLKGKAIKVLDVYDPENQFISLMLQVPEREHMPIDLYRLQGDGIDLIAENDTITVKGNLTNFNGTIEMPYGTLVERISGGGTPIVRETEPDKILEAAHQLDDLEELPYDVTLSGEVLTINDAYSAEYQNITVTISVDGTGDCLKLYRLKGEEAERLAVYDRITVVGRIQNYHGELELVRGEIIEYIPGGGTPPDVQSDPLKIVDAAYALPAGEQLSYDVTLEGKIVELVSPYDPFYWNMSVVIAVEGRENKPILCYRMMGDDIGNHLCIGDTITVTGRLKNYNGTIEFDARCRMTDWKPGSITKPTDPQQIVDAAFALGENETLPYFSSLTGTVTAVTEPYSDQYRNITLVMTVQGTDGPKEIVCYRMKGDLADEVAVGDTITVSGIIKRFVREKDGSVEDYIEFDSGCMLEELHN